MYEYDDYDDYEHYDYDDYDDKEMSPQTIWQKLKLKLRMWYMRIRNRVIPDDIPF